MAEPVVAVLDAPPLEWLFQSSAWPIWAFWGAALFVLVIGLIASLKTGSSSRGRAWLWYGLVAIGLVLLDGLTFKYLLVRTDGYWQILGLRFIPAALFLFLLWRHFEKSNVRLALQKPIQAFGYWVKVAFVLLALALVYTVGIAFAVKYKGHQTAVLDVALWQDLAYGVVLSPLIEELIYRQNLCVPFEKKVGRLPLILLSGCHFTALHAIYGNLAYTNGLAGFFLAWCFLKSRSIWVAIAFHGLINLCVTLHGLVLKSTFLG